MRNLTITAAAGLAFVAAFVGCVPESVHPLGNPETAQQDVRLHGLWVADLADGGTQYLHIGPEPEQGLAASPPEAGLMRFWLIGHTTESGRLENPFGMRFFVTRLGDDNYASFAVPVDENDVGAPRGWWFNKYEVENATLTTWAMDFETVGKLIEAGLVEGTVERDSQGRLKKAVITAASEQVEDFVRDHSEELFPDNLKTSYQRVGSPR